MTAIELNAFLADSAEVVQGKIYSLGAGWNSIFSDRFPFVHPKMALCILISVPYTATNQEHLLEVQLEDADGQQLLIHKGDSESAPVPSNKLSARFNLGRPPLLSAGDSQNLPVSLTINDLKLENPGMYNWVISIDGSRMKVLPMRAFQPTSQF